MGDPNGVSDLLMREAQAWAAMQQLHGGIEGMIDRSTPPAETDYVADAETHALREAAYVGALGQIIGACDSMTQEAIRVRGLRRAQVQIQSTAALRLLRTHSVEALAAGEQQARQAAMGLNAETVRLRTQAQQLKSEIAQTRAVLEELKDADALRLPVGSSILIVVKRGDEQTSFPIETVLERAFELGEGLTCRSISVALSSSPKPAPSPVRHTGRTFPRRSAASSPAPAAEVVAPQ